MKETKKDKTWNGPTLTRKTGCGNIYLILGKDENGKLGKVFSYMGKGGGCASSQAEATASLIAYCSELGGEMAEVIKRLKGISCHSKTEQAVDTPKDSKIMSCPDAIAQMLEEDLTNSKRKK